jgi:hypothetical protein
VEIGIGGFADALTARVELRGETLIVVDNCFRREYSKIVFVTASWGKGVAVAIQFASRNIGGAAFVHSWQHDVNANGQKSS